MILYIPHIDSREFPVGEHKWDCAVVTHPAFDENGTVRSDDYSGNAVSLFGGSRRGMRLFRVTEGVLDGV